MRRGDVWIASGGPDCAGKPRPVVVVQSNRFDATSSVTVCGLTTIPLERAWARLPIVPTPANGLQRSCWLMVDKLATLRRGKLDRQIGRLSPEDIRRLDNVIMVFLGLRHESPSDLTLDGLEWHALCLETWPCRPSS